jgi:hypothetical protein
MDLPQKQGLVGHGVALANERRVITQDQSASFARFNSLCSSSFVSRSRECQSPDRESKSTSTIDAGANCSPTSALDGVIVDTIIPPRRFGSLIGGSMFQEAVRSERGRASNAHYYQRLRRESIETCSHARTPTAPARKIVSHDDGIGGPSARSRIRAT